MIDLVGRNVAIVGAGISGLHCAQQLQSAGCVVQVLDKSNRAGGRLASRIRPEGTWNHGVQQVASQPDVRSQLVSLADGLDCVFDSEVGQLTRVAGGWRLLDQQGGLHGDYAALVLALPAPQARRLLSGVSETGLVGSLERQVGEFVEPLDNVSYDRCWVLLVRCSTSMPVPDVAAHGVISAIYPQADAQCWVVHATTNWSEQHLELDNTSATQSLLMELKALCSADCQFKVEHSEAHRWRYSTVRIALPQPYLWGEQIQLGLCGDWCQPELQQAEVSDIEFATLSGSALAARMLV